MAYTSRIPQLTAQAQAKADEAVRVTALEIEADAKQRSRVETGEMRDGWQARQAGDGWEVSNDVAHSIFNEYGTVDTSAQPMLAPAVEGARPGFVRAMKEIYG